MTKRTNHAHPRPIRAQMSSPTEQWEQLLTPALMQEKLISASLYIAAYDLLKESIIGRIRSFYMVGFNEDREIVGERYETAVAARNKSILYASLDWLEENEVIDKSDCEAFERIKKTRNVLAHELLAIVTAGKDIGHIERFQELVSLLKKIEVWWVVNVEIPVNPDFDEKKIDEEGIVPGPVLMLQMMLEVASGNDELLKHYQAKSNVADGL